MVGGSSRLEKACLRATVNERRRFKKACLSTTAVEESGRLEKARLGIPNLRSTSSPPVPLCGTTLLSRKRGADVEASRWLRVLSSLSSNPHRVQLISTPQVIDVHLPGEIGIPVTRASKVEIPRLKSRGWIRRSDFLPTQLLFSEGFQSRKEFFPISVRLRGENSVHSLQHQTAAQPEESSSKDFASSITGEL
nr:hypothetical protein Itr_chr12CG05940 [Ipomoea trifida]